MYDEEGNPQVDRAARGEHRNSNSHSPRSNILLGSVTKKGKAFRFGMPFLFALCAFGGGFLVSLHLDDGGEAGLYKDLVGLIRLNILNLVNSS